MFVILMEARASLVCIVASFKRPISRGYYHLYIMFVTLVYTMERIESSV